MGRRGAGAQRSVAAERCTAGGGAYRQQLAADHRQGVGSIGAGDHRQGVAASGRRDPLAGRGGSRQPIPPAGRGSSRQPITVRAWQHRRGAIPWAGRGSIGAGDPPARRGSSRQPIHRQDVAAAGRRSTGSRAARAWRRQSPRARKMNPLRGFYPRTYALPPKKIFLLPVGE